jgi:hypothetical protein
MFLPFPFPSPSVYMRNLPVPVPYQPAGPAHTRLNVPGILCHRPRNYGGARSERNRHPRRKQGLAALWRVSRLGGIYRHGATGATPLVSIFCCLRLFQLFRGDPSKDPLGGVFGLLPPCFQC